MKKTPIFCADAPTEVGPYSHAVRCGNFLFVSSHGSVDQSVGKIPPGGPVAEAEQCVKNIRAILKSAGMDMHNVVKTTLYLTDMNHYAAVNEVYAKAFTTPYPARSTMEVKALPLGCLVEIDAIAMQE